MRQLWNDLFQVLKPFSTDGGLKIGGTCDSTSRPRETNHDPLPDRIGNLHEHDWDCARRSGECGHRCGGLGEEDIRSQCDELICEGLLVSQFAPVPSNIDANIACLDP